MDVVQALLNHKCGLRITENIMLHNVVYCHPLADMKNQALCDTVLKIQLAKHAPVRAISGILIGDVSDSLSD